MATTKTLAYHFLKEDMTAGNGTEPAWTDGETRTLKGGRIKICEFGYHASPTPFDVLPYAPASPGTRLCLVELGRLGSNAGSADKLVSRVRTLVRSVDVTRELRLFAADCAERALPLFEAHFPGDARPRKAIEAARAFARGEIGQEELAAYAAATYAAATYAAYAATTYSAATYSASAAYAAAASAANSATYAADAYAARAANSATYAADAYAADAYAAAANSANSATYAAERGWQRDTFNALCYRLLGVNQDA